MRDVAISGDLVFLASLLDLQRPLGVGDVVRLMADLESAIALQTRRGATKLRLVLPGGTGPDRAGVLTCRSAVTLDLMRVTPDSTRIDALGVIDCRVLLLDTASEREERLADDLLLGR